jgi:hypothetical protein
MNEKEIFAMVAVAGVLYLGVWLLNKGTGSGRPINEVSSKAPVGWMVEGADGKVI